MKKIIFGGSFDPIHLGHEKILEKAMHYIGAQECILVPNLKTTYKTSEASPQQRLKMVEIVAQKHHWTVDQFELNNNQTSYTINLVKYLHEKFPHDELYLLIGTDQLNKFHEWYQFEEILKFIKLIVYPRVSYDKTLLEKYNATLIAEEKIDISSTDIRTYFKLEYVDKDVAHYIIMNGVYHEGLLKTYMDEERYLHTMRVAQMAKTITNKFYPDDSQKAWVSGLYHDLAKSLDKQILEIIAYQYLGIPEEPWKTLHGPVGAYLLNKVYGFNNNEILNAIVRHTKPLSYGEPLTFLDKVLYCADKLEPKRTDADIENIQYFRQLFHEDVDKCFTELYLATRKQYN